MVTHGVFTKARSTPLTSPATGRPHSLPRSLAHPRTVSQHLPVSQPWSGTTERARIDMAPAYFAGAAYLWETAGKASLPGAWNQICRPPRLTSPRGRFGEPAAQPGGLQGSGLHGRFPTNSPAGSSVSPHLLPSFHRKQPLLYTCCFFSLSRCLLAGSAV